MKGQFPLFAPGGMLQLIEFYSPVMFPNRAQFNSQICQADPLTHLLFIFFPLTIPVLESWNQGQVTSFFCLFVYQIPM